jgi:hypothetical protein
MLSLAALIAVNEEIAAEAAARNLVPFVPGHPENVTGWKRLPFPNLGPYQPPGWERTDVNWFIDKTGRGYGWEPALTHEQFLSALQQYAAAHPRHGYAIVEEGEFQATIAAFEREGVAR